MGQHSEEESFVVRTDDYQDEVRPYTAHCTQTIWCFKTLPLRILFSSLTSTLVLKGCWMQD